jgi:hypothetical protein
VNGAPETQSRAGSLPHGFYVDPTIVNRRKSIVGASLLAMNDDAISESALEIRNRVSRQFALDEVQEALNP